MVTKQRRVWATEAIESMFRRSGYAAEPGRASVALTSPNGLKATALIGNHFASVDALAQAVLGARSNDSVPLVIFHGDGRTARVPLTGAPRRPSLKGYTMAQKATMISLRAVEKRALADWACPTGHLNYITDNFDGTFQLDVVRLDPVRFDYDHLERNNPAQGFARNGQAKQFRQTTAVLTLSEKYPLGEGICPG